MKSKGYWIRIIGPFAITVITLFAVVCFGSIAKSKEINELEYVVPEEIGWSSVKLEEAE
ncbi:unnamed protein product, partial [marine sediment metagenome]